MIEYIVYMYCISYIKNILNNYNNEIPVDANYDRDKIF